MLEDVKVQSFFPHMHVRGKAMEYSGDLSDRRDTVALQRAEV